MPPHLNNLHKNSPELSFQTIYLSDVFTIAKISHKINCKIYIKKKNF